MYAQIEKSKAAKALNYKAKSLQLKCKDCNKDEKINASYAAKQLAEIQDEEELNAASSAMQQVEIQNDEDDEMNSSSAMQLAEINDEEEKQVAIPAQLKGPSVQRMVMQLYEDCTGSNHHSSIEEKSIVKNYNENFGGGGVGEYALENGDSWAFADLVDTSDKEIYEIKTTNTGADKAQEEAEFYLGLLKNNCSSSYKLGRTFGKQTIDMGQYFSMEYSSPKKGAITYKNIEL